MALLTLSSRGSVILQHEMTFSGLAHSQLKGSVILQHEMVLKGSVTLRQEMAGHSMVL